MTHTLTPGSGRMAHHTEGCRAHHARDHAVGLHEDSRRAQPDTTPLHPKPPPSTAQHDTAAHPTPSHPAPPLLKVSGLRVNFSVKVPGAWRRRAVKLSAVDGIDLSVSAGETLAIVGESGCGKSTLAKVLVGLQPPSEGTIAWQSQAIVEQGRPTGRWPRRAIQMIFQDPLASLDPRMTVFRSIAQPLHLYEPRMPAALVRNRVYGMMEQVGLTPHVAHRHPSEFSGGQCQRIGIARALIGAPSLLICDEPVSALDVSIRAQIINLLKDMQRVHGLALIFIAHDLAVVKHIADRVMVMYLGQAVEQGTAAQVFDTPQHPYTKMLLNAVPVANPHSARQRPFTSHAGELPSPLAVPAGCAFHTRCSHGNAICAVLSPPWRGCGAAHAARCHLLPTEADLIQALPDGHGFGIVGPSSERGVVPPA